MLLDVRARRVPRRSVQYCPLGGQRVHPAGVAGALCQAAAFAMRGSYSSSGCASSPRHGAVLPMNLPVQMYIAVLALLPTLQAPVPAGSAARRQPPALLRVLCGRLAGACAKAGATRARSGGPRTAAGRAARRRYAATHILQGGGLAALFYYIYHIWSWVASPHPPGPAWHAMPCGPARGPLSSASAPLPRGQMTGHGSVSSIHTGAGALPSQDSYEAYIGITNVRCRGRTWSWHAEPCTLRGQLHGGGLLGSTQTPLATVAVVM